MTAKTLNGKTLAATIQTNIKTAIDKLIAQGIQPPKLAVIQVGTDSASTIYVRNKRLACQHVGIHSLSYDLPETTTQAALLQLVDQLNADETVDGILVQLPLPKTIDANCILDRINPEKDIDGFHPYNLGRLAQQHPTLRPCTPYGILKLLQHAQLTLTGKHAVIVGASNIVGRPVALELLLAKATITVCHAATESLHTHVQMADILISSIGKTGIIKSEWIKPGAVVIDVGINRLDNGKIVGDIDFATAKTRAGWITPVPGGVGPMTVATLLHNTLFAANKRRQQ